MLSWASYLFGGSSSEPQQDEDQKTETVAMETEQPADKDWVVVEHDDCNFATKPTHLESHVTCYRGNPLRGDTVDRTTLDSTNVSPSKCDSSSSSPSKHSTPNLSPVSHSRYLYVRTNHGRSTEAWLLTPPSCFTAGENNSPKVGITDLENLLIEHPSMSVYKRSASEGEDSNESDTSNENVSTKRSQVSTRLGAKQMRTLSARTQLLAQVSQVKRAQTMQKKKQAKRESKKCLSRLNAISDKSANSPRKNRVRTPSGRMNGRVPQRKQ